MAPFSKTRYTTQYMQNWGFDDTYKVPTVEILGYEPVGGTMNRIKVAADGTIATSATVDTTGLATSTKQSDGSQKTQLVDAGGEVATITGGKLDVNATVDTTGLALEAGHLATIDTSTAKIPALGQALAAASVPVILPTATITTLTPPAAITGFATSVKQLADNHQVTISNASLAVTGAFYQATQPVSIATMPSTPVTGTFYQATQPVSLATLPVTNAGTFATQETAATTIYNGKKTVTTAGTRVTLAASQAVKSVTIKALIANTGIIYIGDGTVAAANGYALSAGDTISLDIGNLATVNLDSSVNGEGVSFIGIL